MVHVGGPGMLSRDGRVRGAVVNIQAEVTLAPIKHHVGPLFYDAEQGHR